MSNNDGKAWRNYYAIKHYIGKNLACRMYQQGLIIGERVLIAKNKYMFRPLGELDWAWYEAKGLGEALAEGTERAYYEHMLKDERSHPNKWKRNHEEMDKKTKYAVAADKAMWS